MALRRKRILPRERLHLMDRLSRLTLEEAAKVFGPDGALRIQRHANTWEFNDPDDFHVSRDLFRLSFPGLNDRGQRITVTIVLMSDARQRLHARCNACDGACDHVAAAFSQILENKLKLGLSSPPKPPQKPIESLSDDALLNRALEERRQRAKDEKMTIKTADARRPWTDYTVTNQVSGKTYRVALRGLRPGDSYCSCPDFRVNTLGTCKHILRLVDKLKKKFSARELARPAKPKQLAVHLRYDRDVTLRMLIPDNLSEDAASVVKPLRDRALDDVPALLKRLARLQRAGHDVVVYPDAEEFIQQRMAQSRLGELTAEIRKQPAKHPLRKTLLKVPLLPYQLDGVAFAAGAGRSVLADDMGLGKTIQGVGVAEFLAREADVKKVLVVCPASLKSQWRNEIHRFCDRSVQLISGGAARRDELYQSDAFFTVCNYEQVIRDILSIERANWDLIILDEGQRIKNWEAKTSRIIKSLRSCFALVLSGTPLENRVDDLFSILQFVDDRRLGPGFRFFNRHRVVDEKGKVLGYRNLGQLRAAIAPVLLRRTRDSVKLELPPRTTEIVRIPPTDEQRVMHAAHLQIVSMIVRKKYLTEMDLLRLQKELLMCRMVANSTFLVEKKKPAYSTKLERLDELFEQIFEESGRKVVLFSEWTTMLDLIEPLLKKRKLDFVRLDGSVPQSQRQELVHRFQTDPRCALFLTTNAGSTGLNLQAANTVINVDLPWNPAVLEQRIARAHRMGQEQPVQVYVLVTEDTLEEGLLKTLASKRDLALAALDPESTTEQVDLQSGMQELKNRLEILLGAKPIAVQDESVRRQVTSDARVLVEERREKVAAAGGELLGAAFKFLGELVAQQPVSEAPAALVESLQQGLGQCIEQTADGKPRLTVTLPDAAALQGLAKTLALLLTQGSPNQSHEPTPT